MLEVNEVGEPFADYITKLIASQWLLDLWSRVSVDVGAVLDDLVKNGFLDRSKRNLIFDTRVINDTLD